MKRADRWLYLKYRMSGYKLLAEIASESMENREIILHKWFVGENMDGLQGKIRERVKLGIQSEEPVDRIVSDMIDLIPYEERYKPDIKGFTFLPRDPNIKVEKVYSEKENKYKLIAAYDGLIPGEEQCGQSFADLALDNEPSSLITILEDEASNGNMFIWRDVLFGMNDTELAILSTGMSRSGRFILLAGLPDERVYGIASKAVLFGPKVHPDADIIASRISDK